MKALFGLWPWRTQASSNGSDYPPILMNGYETKYDHQEQLKLHLAQTNLTQTTDSKGHSITAPLVSNPRIMPALLRLDSTGEISSVNHHKDSNLGDAKTKVKTKSRSLGSFVAPKMSFNKNFVSPVFQRNFSMPYTGPVHNSKSQPFQSPVDSWPTSKAFHSLSKSNSFPKVKDHSISLDYIQPKDPNNSAYMFGNSILLEKMASIIDSSKDNIWTSYLCKPATHVSQAATSENTVGVQLSHNSVNPSSDTMISNSSLAPSHSLTESESMDSFRSQKQRPEQVNSIEEHTSKSSPSTKCLTSEQDNDSPNKNNISIDIASNSNKISHSGENFLPSVLNTPRKIVKKGRPSSKKQKKRQRQKQKNACRSSPKYEISDLNESESDGCLDRSSSFDIVFTSDESPNSQGCQFKSPRASTPVKDLTKHSEIDSCVVFTLESDSDESDIEFDGCDWSPVESSKVDTSPNDDAVFNVTLSLDTIFKQTSIPSLKSILSDEGSSVSSTSLLSPNADNGKNGLCVINFSFSEDESTQELYDVCDPSLSSSCFFQLSPGLCFDRLFPSNSKSANLEHDHVDSAELPCSSFITEINAKWNLNYPSAGFRSCQSVCKDQIDDPSIKVHFAAEPDLLTVHVVGTEDRCGTWQLYALDRDRFDRRIQEALKVISPVLDHQHRAKIMERNAQLLIDSQKR